MTKRLLILTIALLGASLTVSAQNFTGGAWEFGVNAVGGLPVGDFDDVNEFGIGAMGSLAYRLDPNFTLSLNSGYLRFNGDDITIGNVTAEGPDMEVIPILLGARYTFTGDAEIVRPYLMADAGAYLLSSVGSDDMNADFGVAPALGALFQLSDNVNLDLQANYTAIFNTTTEGIDDELTMNWIGFSAGFAFVMP